MITATALIFANDGAPVPSEDETSQVSRLCSFFEPLADSPALITQRVCELALDHLDRRLARLHIFLGPNPCPWVIAGVLHAAITRQVQDVFIHRWDEARHEYVVLNYL